jgi:hypothetical protein
MADKRVHLDMMLWFVHRPARRPAGGRSMTAETEGMIDLSSLMSPEYQMEI